MYIIWLAPSLYIVCVARRCVVIATKFNIESNSAMQGIRIHDDGEEMKISAVAAVADVADVASDKSMYRYIYMYLGGCDSTG